MTDTNQQAAPHGFTQLTERRIRTTDIIFGESGGWAIPHVFLVGGNIGAHGRLIARPHFKKPGSRGRVALSASIRGRRADALTKFHPHKDVIAADLHQSPVEAAVSLARIAWRDFVGLR